MLHIQFGFGSSMRFQRRCLNIMVIYMYIAPGWGQMSPWGPIFFRIINIQSYFPFPARFSPQMTLKVFPIPMHWRPMLTLSYNRSRSPQGHDLYIHCSTSAIGASYQVSLKSVLKIRRRFLKGFYHIWAWQPSWLCELDNLYIH